VDEDVAFERLLRIVESKKLLGKDSTFYAKLHHLRKLRNRVHLFLTDGEFDHDWHAFGLKDLRTMKEILFGLLTDPYFGPTSEERMYFEYLAAEGAV
jgi:hypothetical protein